MTEEKEGSIIFLYKYFSNKRRKKRLIFKNLCLQWSAVSHHVNKKLPEVTDVHADRGSRVCVGGGGGGGGVALTYYMYDFHTYPVVIILTLLLWEQKNPCHSLHPIPPPPRLFHGWCSIDHHPSIIAKHPGTAHGHRVTDPTCILKQKAFTNSHHVWFIPLKEN